ncbi:2TM domain-containing protein [Lonsdalea quercina]|uniref:2TM domain-containing protein n=1 Tax=Lonsdalea quercina TaxID=71657 RepID=UPI00397528DB
MNPVKLLRLNRAWSQEHLAELSSLSVRTIQRIENGERASLETLGAIAAALEVKVSALMENGITPAGADTSLEQRNQEARNQVREEGRFWRGMILFVLVNLALFIINRFAAPQSHWFLWPLLIWGGILTLRGGKLFLLRRWLTQWERVRLQKILRR